MSKLSLLKRHLKDVDVFEQAGHLFSIPDASLVDPDSYKITFRRDSDLKGYLLDTTNHALVIYYDDEGEVHGGKYTPEYIGDSSDTGLPKIKLCDELGVIIECVGYYKLDPSIDKVTVPFTKRCPVCSSDPGYLPKSTITPMGPTCSTKAMVQRYYDSDGIYHYHDSNRRTTEFKCSTGHKFSVSTSGFHCKPCVQKRTYVASYYP